jgi:hypothetical protein
MSKRIQEVHVITRKTCRTFAVQISSEPQHSKGRKIVEGRKATYYRLPTLICNSFSKKL